MAEALEALLAALNLDKVHVVGYSLGARVALQLCSRPGQCAAFAILHANLPSAALGQAMLLCCMSLRLGNHCLSAFLAHRMLKV
jgi:pimeloyl-ACP methyl ester carboxylesterase